MEDFRRRMPRKDLSLSSLSLELAPPVSAGPDQEWILIR